MFTFLVILYVHFHWRKRVLAVVILLSFFLFNAVMLFLRWYKVWKLFIEKFYGAKTSYALLHEFPPQILFISCYCNAGYTFPCNHLHQICLVGYEEEAPPCGRHHSSSALRVQHCAWLPYPSCQKVKDHWFFRSEVCLTEPANVEYILKTNFQNYGKVTCVWWN